jgi:hypothetical protein
MVVAFGFGSFIAGSFITGSFTIFGFGSFTAFGFGSFTAFGFGSFIAFGFGSFTTFGFVRLTVFAFGDFNFFFNVGVGVCRLAVALAFFVTVFFVGVFVFGGLGVFSTKINFFFVCFFFGFRTSAIIYIKIIIKVSIFA